MSETGYDDGYILGTDNKELRRLEQQHQIWRQETATLWERAGFRSGQTIVDLGCGPGYTTLDLIEIVGSKGKVIAVDSSEKFTNFLKNKQTMQGINNFSVRVDDVQHLNLPEASVDGAFTRWLMCYVNNPQAVIAGVARALKPGGSFAVMDFFNYRAITIEPRSQIFDRIYDSVYESIRESGGDLDVGGRIPRMMYEKGFQIADIKQICSIGRPGSSLWTWLTTFQESYLPKLVDMGHITELERKEFEQEWVEREKDPCTFFFSPPMIGVIGTKV